MGCKRADDELQVSLGFEGMRNKQEENIFHLNTDRTLRGCEFSKKEQGKQQFQLADNQAFHF